MKKIVLSTMICISLYAGGIPVVDVVSNAQALAQNMKTIAEYAEQANRWKETLEQYKKQVQNFEDELIAKTGLRSSVQFVQDVNDFYEFSKNYKEDFMKLGTDLLNPSSIISIKAKSLYDKYNLANNCESDLLSPKEKEICVNKIGKNVKEIAVYEQFNKQIDTIGTNVANLSQKLASSNDIKESADIGNAIGIQMAQLEITKTQVNLMNSQNIRVAAIEEEQAKQLMYNRVHTPDRKDIHLFFEN